MRQRKQNKMLSQKESIEGILKVGSRREKASGEGVRSFCCEMNTSVICEEMHSRLDLIEHKDFY